MAEDQSSQPLAGNDLAANHRDTDDNRQGADERSSRPPSKAPGNQSLDKFDVEARLIELGSVIAAAQQLFKALERDFYWAAFGRYEE